jgi:hypothetical protein
MSTTILTLIAIVVFVVTCFYPGVTISRMSLGDPSTEHYSKLRRYAAGTLISLCTGLACTVAFFILVPLAIVGIAIVIILLFVSVFINHTNGN